jgi:hypothetical protein
MLLVTAAVANVVYPRAQVMQPVENAHVAQEVGQAKHCVPDK